MRRRLNKCITRRRYNPKSLDSQSNTHNSKRHAVNLTHSPLLHSYQLSTNTINDELHNLTCCLTAWLTQLITNPWLVETSLMMYRFVINHEYITSLKHRCSRQSTGSYRVSMASLCHSIPETCEAIFKSRRYKNAQNKLRTESSQWKFRHFLLPVA